MEERMEEVAATRTVGPALRWVVGAIIVLAVLAVVLILVGGGTGLRRYKILNSAMAPTFRVGQTVTVDLRDHSPALGQVIVFYAPLTAMASQTPCGNPREGYGHVQACDRTGAGKSTAVFIKRVVGMPGDRISLVNGDVIRNGGPERLIRTALCRGAVCSFPKPITVPPSEYFVLGDNRSASDDSRFWGPVPRAWIIGTALQ
jgi:signal peptidase I